MMLENGDWKKYEDIIDLERPLSKKHMPMSIHDRAAQFASFAALKGYDEAVRNKVLEVEKIMMRKIDKRFVYYIDRK